MREANSKQKIHHLNMAGEECGGPSGFNVLFIKNVPHILEKIFFFLDYESFKMCMDVNRLLNNLLKSESYRKKARAIFCTEISEDERRLHSASKYGRTDEVRRLLSSGMLEVDCLPLPYPCWTALYEAATLGHYEVVKLLVERGADRNKASAYGQLPTHVAAEEGHENVVRLFLDRGMDPDKADGYGMTALHWAACADHRNVAKVFLDAGARLDKVDNHGQTPLHYAAEYGSDDAYELLLESGADPNKADNHGNTPIDLLDVALLRHLPSAH